MSDDPMDDVALESIFHTKKHVYFPVLPESLSEGSVILDVGAWHGFYAVGALRRHPGTRLVAVEPDPVGCELIRANLLKNGFLNRAEIIEAGVGVASGFANLQAGRNSLESWTRPVNGAEHHSKPRGVVRLLTLKEILRGRLPSIVKCNAQGAEYALFPQLFRNDVFPDLVILETHPEFGSPHELLDLIRDAGYEIKQVNAFGRSTWYHCWLSNRNARTLPSELPKIKN